MVNRVKISYGMCLDLVNSVPHTRLKKTTLQVAEIKDILKLFTTNLICRGNLVVILVF